MGTPWDLSLGVSTKMFLKGCAALVFMVLLLVDDCAARAYNYSAGYESPSKYVEDTYVSSNSSSGASLESLLPAEVTDYVSNSLNNGAKVMSEYIDGAKPMLEAVNGFFQKLTQAYAATVQRLSGRPEGRPGLTDKQLDDGLENLQKEVAGARQDVYDYSKGHGIHKDAEIAMHGIREGILEAGKGKQFLDEKVKELNSGVNEVIMLLADETKDLPVKVKPAVDAIVKAKEVWETPEVQKVIKGIEKFFEGPCRWNYSYERRTYLDYNSSNYLWLDPYFIKCLKKKGKEFYTASSMIENYAYVPYQQRDKFIKYLRNNHGFY